MRGARRAAVRVLAVARGELRNDLYYRLNVFNIHMPSLREHREDIPDLVHALLAEMSSKHGRRIATVSEAVLNAIKNYTWPGNVRELKNVVERAFVLPHACQSALTVADRAGSKVPVRPGPGPEPSC